MGKFFDLVCGAAALISAVAVLGTQAGLSLRTFPNSPGRVLSILSALLEAIVFIVMAWLCMIQYTTSMKTLFRPWQGIILGIGISTCTLATAFSVASLAIISKTTPQGQDDLSRIIIGSSIALGFALSSQLIFIAIHFGSARQEPNRPRLEVQAIQHTHTLSFKAIRYSNTVIKMNKTDDITLMKSRDGSSSGGDDLTTEKSTALKSSPSQVSRSTSFRKALTPRKDRYIPPRLQLQIKRGSAESFSDSVEPHIRLAVIEASTPTETILYDPEAIFASPTSTRASSPTTPEHFQPPRVRPRSRSFSPASLSRELLSLTPPGSICESHIHPLFRSDSPDPPPVATPGTSVIASPNAGRVIRHQLSTQSLRRIRSGSLPMSRSPLSQQGSFDDFRSLMLQNERASTLNINESTQELSPRSPRKMSSLVPEWILRGKAETRSP